MFKFGPKLRKNFFRETQQMKISFLIKEYVKWRIRSKTRHGVHSPFLYQFLDQCLYMETENAQFEIPENQRRKLKKDPTILEYIDPGAGSRKQKPKTSRDHKRKNRVFDIARNSLQRPKNCRLFYRMIHYFRYHNVLELGTSFGITTSYMSLAGEHVKIDTIEGAQPIADLAEKYFTEKGFTNIHLHRGNFDQKLSEVVSDKKYDLIFMDGNHYGNKTFDYFQKLTKHINERGVIIVDDIRWSESMLEAWQKIRLHSDVTLSIDFYYMGMVFFDKRFTNEEFAIRF
jgi:predicted O-methyltransferase YrrM